MGFEIAIEKVEMRFQMSRYERSENTRDAVRVVRGEGRKELADSMLRALEDGDD